MLIFKTRERKSFCRKTFWLYLRRHTNVELSTGHVTAHFNHKPDEGTVTLIGRLFFLELCHLRQTQNEAMAVTVSRIFGMIERSRIHW